MHAWFFDKSKHDGISWNALIIGLLDCGYSSHVGNCIEKMYLEKIHVDCGIYVAVLNACSRIYALNEGKKYILKSFLKDMKKIFLLEAIWSTYMQKCCAVCKGHCILE